uniref:Steroid 5-alpha reductase C-terminal domain-containing protein n=1 Tax=Chromera velia CCMP2878 TaxID=1169474 RepID=A0A0G4GMB8_9ALVE|eukprot:Cvel_22535.t1-p1 / transcript=Cvel_22535.t1 / gene=Cvel_22535 / organism=Chromera_velia_CCMP2878 / gene_product=Uncharacterized protein C594.04c, putative / transcript_product=Uncharacterized protein C594.04c, putative / location=Cvel_scaffold2224:27657-28930(+) / protein_length=263 / sequence_SO=supercontig / SO=protein_coding / is_pseudo=false
MDNYSIVDKLWSVTPAFYCTLYSAVSAYYTEQLNLRLVLMSMLTAAWGGRLTFNFWRKGGYALRAEDYRWAILREKIPWILWQPFNLSFICIYQHYLLFLIASPAYFVASQQPSPLDLYDLLIALLFLFFLLVEGVADEQQWQFHLLKSQNEKRELWFSDMEPEEVADVRRGFLSRGLWAYSRHPNFLCENLIWWTFGLFTRSFSFSSWTWCGPFLLSLLFWGSTRFTESISGAKYYSYAEYQKRVPFFPSIGALVKGPEKLE